ncbi:hypothetical protein pkur_cds_448 [Pandoravirus kuranda]|uniref:Uncharacterized protein n=2 Tax=Pandoravirus TaxID=2060084 RepID=A0AA95J3M7_9VIRU|nr:hypothetical protein pneo_cds_484 [Pandoravirus neocaledonia]AVK76091.1 hypothetical protein pneo_cds_484 [Pandoravirus neocaledonia]WBR14622.1 hypothetical protein pkur_cds_448 [Pandoravirus kuranda]
MWAPSRITSMRGARSDPEFDAAVRMCAAVQQGPSTTLSADDAERLAAYGRYARAPVVGSWSAQAQCEALARIGGPEWVSAVQAQPARPHVPLQRGYSDSALLAGNARPHPVKRRRLAPRQPQLEILTAMQTTPPTPGQVLGVEYERDLPPELQDAIMRHLARADPRAALALGATGRQQAEILAALPAPRQEGTGGIERVRVAAALGVDDGSPIEVAVALCLLQALAEFRAAQGIDTIGRGERNSWGAVIVPGQGQVDNLVERVAADRRVAGTRDRAQIWYQWLTTSPFGAAEQEKTRMERLYGPMRASFRAIGKFDVVDLLRMSQTGIEAGQGTAPPGLSLTVQPIALFVPLYGRLATVLDDIVTADELDEWASQGWLGDRVMPDQDVVEALGSTQALENLARFVDEGVRAHLTRRCAVVRPDGHRVVPNFTDVFDTRFYLVPLDNHIVLMADIGTPRVQELLFGQAGKQ